VGNKGLYSAGLVDKAAESVESGPRGHRGLDSVCAKGEPGALCSRFLALFPVDFWKQLKGPYLQSIYWR